MLKSLYKKYMEQKHLYQITVNREQLLLIANCLEDISRFASGQPELYHTISLLVQDDSCKRDQINEHLEAVKKIIFPELRNASYSYDGGDQAPIRKNLIGNTYQIYRQILHFLALDENWNNVYCSITLESGNLGTISVEKK